MERLNLEQINNMTPDQMREYLRGLEVENQRKDTAERIAAEEKQREKEESKKQMDDFFKRKFAMQKPMIGGQY